MTGPDPVLQRAWAVLSSPSGEALTSFLLDTRAHGEACRVALDRAGARHVLVPVGDEVLQELRQGSTLGTKVRDLTFGGRTLRYVDVFCTDGGVFAEFDEVVADVLRGVSGSSTPAEETLRTIERWRSLFRSRLVRGLGPREVRGLFAELVVLEAVLSRSADTSPSVWRGPLQEPHDFELARRCLEVKALGATSEEITVHGIGQLDVHDARPLDLALVRVVDDPAGTALADLIARLQDRSTENDALAALLLAAGWDPEADDAAAETFVVAEVLRIPVEGAVPRLVRGSFSTEAATAGVTDVTYRIQRSALLPFVDGASLDAVADGAMS